VVLSKLSKTLLILATLPFLMGSNWAPEAAYQTQIFKISDLTRLDADEIEYDLWFFSQSERQSIDIMARTIYGEARGEKTTKALFAIAHVILNRVEHKNWGETAEEVITQPLQFSCWNKNDPNRELIQNVTLEDQGFRKAYRAAIAVMQRTIDPTKGATHYHSVHIKKPHWAKAKSIRSTGKVGNHVFYKG
jgi:N-acetylmuramoyl-L-alanine amidase